MARATRQYVIKTVYDLRRDSKKPSICPATGSLAKGVLVLLADRAKYGTMVL